ncbi:MAG: zinc-ribbon and DUF3426 domain-containing protein [Saezia sp.]
MTLAARCPQCNTIFRVVPDQLKISDGLVRCGQCQHVFNALEHQLKPAVPTVQQHEAQKHQQISEALNDSLPMTLDMEREEKKLSELLDDSGFLDSLLSEFQIGWVDTVADPRSADKRSLLSSASQTKDVVTLSYDDDEHFDEFIELDTDFTESLMSLDDSSYDISDLVVEEDGDDEFLTSQFFSDTLTNNFSLGSEDTVLGAETRLKPVAEKPLAAKEPLPKQEATIKPPTLNKVNLDITPLELSILPDEADKPVEPRNLVSSKPIIIPPPAVNSSGQVENSAVKTKFSLIDESEDASVKKASSQEEKGLKKDQIHTTQLQEYEISLSDEFSATESSSIFATTGLSEDSELSATLLSKYADDSTLVATRLNEKYEKIATSLHEQQLANLSFVQQNRSFWEKPIVKIANFVLALALLMTLVAQTIHYRNYIISYAPSLRPVFVTLLEPFGLTVAYPISFELNKNVTIDSLSLNTMPDGSYLLELIIRNREPYPVAVPYLELTLENVSAEVIARKVFSPAELGIDKPALEPHKELVIRSTIHLNAQNITHVGYSTNLLYL